MPLISPRKQMQFLYRRAAGPDDFPWHEDKPSRLLEEAVASRPTKGRALDLGCGSGFYTVHLAQQGFEVTGSPTWSSEGASASLPGYRCRSGPGSSSACTGFAVPAS